MSNPNNPFLDVGEYEHYSKVKEHGPKKIKALQEALASKNIELIMQEFCALDAYLNDSPSVYTEPGSMTNNLIAQFDQLIHSGSYDKFYLTGGTDRLIIDCSKTPPTINLSEHNATKLAKFLFPKS
jgi:hypothetical protein